MFDWDDLRHFLAVANAGSTTAAARLLNVDQSTVQRRLAELERRIGQPLVQRHPSGYRLTPFGEQLLPHARRVEESMQALERVVQSSARELTGVVRVTCPEPIVYRLSKSQLLERFRSRHPRLQVEFLMSDRYLDLGKGEADVALRSGDTVDGDLVGRKVGDSLWAVYGSHAFLERHGKPQDVRDLARFPLVGFDEGMAGHRAAAWLRQVAPGARLAATADSVLGLVSSAKAGMGLAPLPHRAGRCRPGTGAGAGPDPRTRPHLAHPHHEAPAPDTARVGVLRLHGRRGRGAAADPHRLTGGALVRSAAAPPRRASPATRTACPAPRAW